MRFFHVLLLAVAVNAAKVKVITTQTCKTYLGTVSTRSVPRTTRTSHRTVTAGVKVCPTVRKTMTPAVTSRTVTIRTIETNTVTNPQKTDTATVTENPTVTDTTVAPLVMVTVTVNTDTTTVITPTSTLPAPPNFTPLGLMSDFWGVRKRKQDFRADLAPVSPRDTNRKLDFSLKASKPKIYPSKVGCWRTLQTVTTKTVTCSKRPTKTQTLLRKTLMVTTTTTVATTTTTELPMASTTLIVTVTSTDTFTQKPTSTKTETETDTVMSFAPSETFYAACAPNNLMNAGSSGRRIASLKYVSTILGSQKRSFIANSAYDCCVACQTSTSCLVMDYHPNVCTNIMSVGDVCLPAIKAGVTYATDMEPAAGSQFFIGNGPCGQYANGG